MPHRDKYPCRWRKSILYLSIVFFASAQTSICRASDDNITTRGTLTVKTSTTFTVDSVLYAIDDDTELKDDLDNEITYEQFSVGDRVKAKGEFKNSTLIAESLELDQSSGADDSEEDADEFEIEGLISEISSTSITVQGQTFSIASSTKIVDEEKKTLAVADLAVGDKVEIEYLSTNESLAKKIKLKLESEDSDDSHDENDVEVAGRITALTAESITVRSQNFILNDETRYESHHHVPVEFSALSIGDLVEIDFVITGAEKIARKVQLENSESEFELKGAIAAITDSSVTVRGTTATLNNNTRYRGAHGVTKLLSDFNVGQLVKLKVKLTQQDSFTARELRILDSLGHSSNFDDSGDDDKAIFRQSNGTWYLRYRTESSSDSSEAIQWGLPGDIDVAADYDGDGRTDLAVFRPNVGTWFILTSSTGFKGTKIVQWGLPGDQPIYDDIDGDAVADIGIWRPSTGSWYILLSRGGNRSKALAGDPSHVLIRQWGLPQHKAETADLDGDEREDFIAIDEDSGVWYSLLSSSGYNREAALSGVASAGQAQQFGLAGDKFLVGDFDGDGIDDRTVFRAGQWYIRFSSNQAIIAVTFGLPGDVPGVVHARSDDSDARDHITVYRPSEGNHYDRSPLGDLSVTQWGLPNTDDRPVGDFAR